MNASTFGQSVVLIFSLIGFFGGLAALIFFEQRSQALDSRAKIAGYLKSHWKSTVVGLLTCLLGGGAMFGLITLLIARAMGWALGSYKRIQTGNEKRFTDMRDQEQQRWIASLGKTREERIARINEIFDRKDQTLKTVVWCNTPVNGWIGFRIARNLAAMDTRHRESLRNVELLAAAGVDQGWCMQKKFGLLWGDGKASIEDYVCDPIYAQSTGTKDSSAAIGWLASAWGLSVEAAVNDVLHKVESLSGDANADAVLKMTTTSIKERQTGGSIWLTPGDLANSIFDPNKKPALRLGVLEGTDVPLSFSGEGSLITIAPPGSGKTQCHVIPTLLSWAGPAIVLDVKGELYGTGTSREPGTSKWRAEHVGPVYRFSPLDPASSHRYNPLTFVRAETDLIWKDSTFVAEMMIVPSDAPDPFFEEKAQQVLTAAIAHVCYSAPPDRRPMSQILDIVHGGKPWDQMILGLQTAVDVKPMMRLGESLSTMSEKTRDSVLQTVQSKLKAWNGELIERMTETSDWSPLDLRSGKNPTIYICVRPSEIDSYASMLRVLIAQHLMMLASEAAPEGASPILFLLDELPRLRYMPPVETGIEIGRSYGIKLWMFVQSFGQLENAYPNAAGMMAECAVQIYMNPSGADGTAEALSERLGYRESVMDGTRQLLVEAPELAGPQYRDKQLVFGSSCKPAKVKKAFAWQDSELQSRMGTLRAGRSTFAGAANSKATAMREHGQAPPAQ